jgi:hypothetical protein
MSDQQLWDKFSACVHQYMGKSNQSKVKERLNSLQSEANIASLMHMLSIGKS